MKILVTGAAGFIASNLCRMLLKETDAQILGLDAFTYAARPEWILGYAEDFPDQRFKLTKCDLRDFTSTKNLIDTFQPDQVYHLAAESHVCRSIDGPRAFIESNSLGTFNLLESLRQSGFKGRMVHVSTDEAFGELDHDDEPFSESTPIEPNSPYSASKAASDLFCRAFYRTYGMDIVITRCTNNYGPNQHEEKLIPRTILKFLRSEPMTLFGDGTHSRDWIYVDDHCRGLMLAMQRGATGNLYCIGSALELSNHDVVNHVADVLRQEIGWQGDVVIEFTNGRPTDDVRYAVKTDKIQELGLRIPNGVSYFQKKLAETVKWYAGKK